MDIRSRHDNDLAPLAAEIERSNRADHWPPHWPSFDDGFRLEQYLAAGEELAAFVAVDGDSAVAHVALHQDAAAAVVERATGALGLPSSKLAFVARLYVAPEARRRGVAAKLLARVATHARDLGRSPILDVWDQLGPANSLYEASGWHAVGSVTIAFRSPCSPRCTHGGREITSLVRVAPGVEGRGAIGRG